MFRGFYLWVYMETLVWTWSDLLRRFIVCRVCSGRVCSDAFKWFQSVTFGFFNGSSVCTGTLNIMLELWMKIQRAECIPDAGDVWSGREVNRHINTVCWTSGTHFCLLRALSSLLLHLMCRWPLSQMSAIFTMTLCRLLLKVIVFDCLDFL